MAVVLLPRFLAEQARGARRFEVDEPTVGQALAALPVADLVLDERGALRELVNVYVGGRDVRELGGLGVALRADDTVRVVAAVAGGGHKSVRLRSSLPTPSSPIRVRPRSAAPRRRIQDELVLAFLREREDRWTRGLVEAGARRRGTTPEERLLGRPLLAEHRRAH